MDVNKINSRLIALQKQAEKFEKQKDKGFDLYKLILMKETLEMANIRVPGPLAKGIAFWTLGDTVSGIVSDKPLKELVDDMRQPKKVAKIKKDLNDKLTQLKVDKKIDLGFIGTFFEKVLDSIALQTDKAEQMSPEEITAEKKRLEAELKAAKKAEKAEAKKLSPEEEALRNQAIENKALALKIERQKLELEQARIEREALEAAAAAGGSIAPVEDGEGPGAAASSAAVTPELTIKPSDEKPPSPPPSGAAAENVSDAPEESPGAGATKVQLEAVLPDEEPCPGSTLKKTSPTRTSAAGEKEAVPAVPNR